MYISPFTLVYVTLPQGPLAILRYSWSGARELPFYLGKNPAKYLLTLRQNLETAKRFVETAGVHKQDNYVHKYSLRSTDRSFQVGDRVIILSPVGGTAKFRRRWQCPGVVVEVKSPYSYIVEIDNIRHHVHVNKVRK